MDESIKSTAFNEACIKTVTVLQLQSNGFKRFTKIERPRRYKTTKHHQKKREGGSKKKFLHHVTFATAIKGSDSLVHHLFDDQIETSFHVLVFFRGCFYEKSPVAVRPILSLVEGNLSR